MPLSARKSLSLHLKHQEFMPMDFVSVKEYAAAHGLAERTIRNYCVQGKIRGAKLIGKTWSIPADAALPQRKKSSNGTSPLLEALRREKEANIKGGIYHRTQIDFTYNSNHIEGSRLTQEQTRYIYETNTIGTTEGGIRVDDIIETTNHFRCIDYIIDHATAPLSESMIKQLHGLLKSGTSDASKPWFVVGGNKRLPNEVGGLETVPPETVGAAIRALLKEYKAKKDSGLGGHPRLPPTLRTDTSVSGRQRACRKTGYVQRMPEEWHRPLHHHGRTEDVLLPWPARMAASARLPDGHVPYGTGQLQTPA